MNQPDCPAEDRQSALIRCSQGFLLLVGLFLACTLSGCRLYNAQLPGFLVALSISWWLTPEILKRAKKLGLVDKPGDPRKIHKTPTPRLGGVAIYVSLMASLFIMMAICGRIPRQDGFLGIALGGTIIFLLGLLDDLEPIAAKVKLVVQILAAVTTYSLGVRIKYIPIPLATSIDFWFIHLHGNHPLELGLWSLPLTVIWLVLMTNAVNLIDGVDGVSGGVSTISAMAIWAVALAPSINQPYAALLAATLAGALLGFLRWNFNPARIFIGDSGAYLAGFVLGTIAITGVLKGVAVFTLIVPSFVLILMILFFPLLDTAWAVIRRTIKGKSIFSPDAEHIHHRLLQVGLSAKMVAYLFYAATALLGLVAAYLVNQQRYYLSLCAFVLFLSLFFSEVLNKAGRRQSKSKT